MRYRFACSRPLRRGLEPTGPAYGRRSCQPSTVSARQHTVRIRPSTVERGQVRPKLSPPSADICDQGGHNVRTAHHDAIFDIRLQNWHTNYYLDHLDQVGLDSRCELMQVVLSVENVHINTAQLKDAMGPGGPGRPPRATLASECPRKVRFSHNINVVGLFTSLTQALRRRCREHIQA